jgi:2-dehydro-3-deoxyglucarate aldolase
VDAYIVGPYDLSGSIGLPGEFEAPQFLEAIEEIRSVSRRLQVPGGVHIVEPDPEALRDCIAQGNQFIAYGVDTRMLDTSCRQGLQAALSKGSP